MTRVQIGGLLALDPVRSVVLGRQQALEADALTGLDARDLKHLQHFHLAMTGRAMGEGCDIAVPDLPLELVQAATAEIMGLFGDSDPLALYARRGSILLRAASRLRAATDASPATLRHVAEAGDLRVAGQRQPYAQFFAVEEYDVGWRRFDGRMTPPVTRATFVSGDAVTVLPYDPIRDRVLVVEQFRAGPMARGDRQPWQIEAIAGRIDPGESAEDAARREAVEEAGLTLGALHRVAGYYPSPGGLTEYLYSYVAITDLPDGVAGVFGLDSEQEDIRGHLIGFERLMELVDSGEVANAPLILTTYWLARARNDLCKKN